MRKTERRAITRPRTSSRLALLVATLAVGQSCPALAQSMAQSMPPGSAGGPTGTEVAQAELEPEPPTPSRVRLTVSTKANERLIARRLRALLRIQLGEEAIVDPGAVGSLEDEIIYVWIDVPNPRLALIEVRGHALALGRRTLAIADFPADVAARVVAIEASEMVRVQAEASRRTDQGPEPSGPGPGALRGDRAGIALDASFDVQGLPATEPSVLFGPTLGVEHRQQFTAQTIYLRWHSGPDDAGGLRWLEVGAGFDLRFSLVERLRLTVGARAGAVVLGLPDGTRIDGRADADVITARAAGSLGLETPLTQHAWLGLRLEPGAVLRSLTYAPPTALEPRAIEGFSMVGGLSLRVTPWW